MTARTHSTSLTLSDSARSLHTKNTRSAARALPGLPPAGSARFQSLCGGCRCRRGGLLLALCRRLLHAGELSATPLSPEPAVLCTCLASAPHHTHLNLNNMHQIMALQLTGGRTAPACSAGQPPRSSPPRHSRHSQHRCRPPRPRLPSPSHPPAHHGAQSQASPGAPSLACTSLPDGDESHQWEKQ